MKTLSFLNRLMKATQALDKIPHSGFVYFKLNYYENTPFNYEPPHFKKFKSNDGFESGEEFDTLTNEMIHVGGIETNFHCVEFNIKSNLLIN